MGNQLAMQPSANMKPCEKVVFGSLPKIQESCRSFQIVPKVPDRVVQIPPKFWVGPLWAF